jgi:hypothetical protein
VLLPPGSVDLFEYVLSDLLKFLDRFLVLVIVARRERESRLREPESVDLGVFADVSFRVGREQSVDTYPREGKSVLFHVKR